MARSKHAAIRSGLLDWYDDRTRDVIARGSDDPYVVWAREVMLQQTRMETVRPFFAAWMDRFPDVASLAAASDDEVIAAWSGLGYYARARNLRQAARQIVESGWPADAAGWRRLPGIGPYTAAAISSILHDEPVAAIDGNATRVLARLFAIPADVGTAAGRRAVAEAGDALIDPARPGDWNQAIMDLGATVCAPAPACADCPLADPCQARATGRPMEFPVKARKTPPTPMRVHFALVMGDGRLLLVKRPDGGLLAGTWALPGGDQAIALSRHVLQQAGLHVQMSQAKAKARHTFTHRVWDMEIYTCHVLDVEPGEPTSEVRWVPLNRLEGAGLSTAMKKGLAAAGLPVP